MDTPVPLILVVDDNDAARYVKTRVLTRAGYRVIEAATGGAGIAQCRSARPDLMLLDVKLPDINGLEVCRRLKTEPETAGTLVLQTSAAMIDTAHRVRALDTGADSFLVEPIEPEELLANVKALLRLRRAESAWAESEARFRRFADSVDDVFWIYAPQQRSFTYLSSVHERLFGQPVADVLAQPDARLERVHPDDRERVRARFEAGVDKGVYEEEYRVLHADGTERWIAERAFPIFDEAGDIASVAGIAQDSTLRKQAELVLMEADRQKDEFLAMLAHELRNPLGPMRSASDYLRVTSEVETAQGQHALDIMSRQVTHLARLVDDLLDVSRISQGKINLRQDDVLLSDVLSSARDAVTSMAEGRRQRLVVNPPAEAVWLRADAVRLSQVFGNLLHNACKFTPEGGAISVDARAEGHQVVVTVSDNGAGIRAELLPRVFDLFTQDEANLDRSLGGLGIGLSLVKRLVELHDGQVSVDSAGLGRGTTFTVRLPRQDAPAQPASTAPAQAAQAPLHKKVLVVDDNVDAGEALSMLIEASGHEVAYVHNGPQALDHVGTDRPDVVLLDIGLPQMNGYEVARRLRALPSLASTTLIAVSGYGSDADKALAREAGFHHHLTKPVDFDELITLIEA